MFPALEIEIRDRFAVIDSHFRYSARSPLDVEQSAKGIVFVEIYAVYEYTVKQATQTAIQLIAAYGHRFSDLRPSLAAVFLDSQLDSLKGCAPAKTWDKRLELFEMSYSKNPVAAVAVVPHDGSHFRHTQVQIIFRSLGITRSFVRLKRHLPMIDEIVRHRNSIAHGSESAKQIGRNFSRSEIHRRIQLMKNICLRIVAITSEHCARPERHKRRI